MFKKLLICVFCLSVLALAGGGLWLWQGLQTLEQPVALDEPVLFSVPSGSGYGQVARKLEAEGLVGDSLWLKIHGRLYPEQALLKAGEYEFTDGMTSLDMINAMVAGDTKHWQIQFIEGWTFRDMRAALASSERLGQVTADWTDDRIMEEMGANGSHPEGRFFPDTYLFTSSETDLDLLRRAFERMEEVLATEWQAKAENLPYDSPYDAIIRAS